MSLLSLLLNVYFFLLFLTLFFYYSILSTEVLCVLMIINKETNSNIEFLIWIPKLKLSTLFIYYTLTIRVDLIEMTLIQTRTHKPQISEMLAIAAISLLLIHIADGSMERIIKHGFLPMSIDKKPFKISNFGIYQLSCFS